MTELPPYGPPQYPAAPVLPTADRVRNAWQRRHESDYVFDFWTALGWTILTCGFYGIYVTYQLMRRSRDHNLRRLELLDAATTFAWERAQAQGCDDELRPAFERIAAQMMVLRRLTTEFRDPALWALIAITGVGQWIAYVFIDGDLVAHDFAEGAVEHELAAIYARLGAAVAAPDPSRLKGQHNYAGRIVATLLTCGLYGYWWLYDIMTETNRHFRENWRWEDDLARAVQQLLVA